MMNFPNVTATAKANIYFEGGVISHTIVLSDGTRKTLGIIFPGTYHFNTGVSEQMEIIDGTCEVILNGHKTPSSYTIGSTFEIPAKSGFTITVGSGICQYICSFLD